MLDFVKKMLPVKKPIIKDNTFLIWEPCGKSHAEVVPGFAKYLCDLGYHVSVIVSKNAYKENLFSRIGENLNISYNKMSKYQARAYFKQADLSDVKGLLVTTVDKLCKAPHFDRVYENFDKNVDKSKLYFVIHDIKERVWANAMSEDLISLRELNFEQKDYKTVVVNPHYFGDVKITQKSELTNFVTVGELTVGKKNFDLFVKTVQKLVNNGITNFKITVIGKGKVENLPPEVVPYFDIKGRLPFDKMFEEIEKGDFILTSYIDEEMHLRYIHQGTSGNFQLVYGFQKPIIIKDNFAPINGFSEKNSILYKDDDDFYNALIKGINMSQEQYHNMQEDIKAYAHNFYQISKLNLKSLIDSRQKNKKDNLTIGIPTLLKDAKILGELLDSLVTDNVIKKIIVINNSQKEFYYDNPKVEIKASEGNMYVNPAWNYVAEVADTEYVALLNDDIKIPQNFCSQILALIDDNTGIVGISPKNVTNARNENNEITKEPKAEDLILSNNIQLKTTPYKTEDFGVFMLFNKKNYVKIPPEFEVYYGDDWIFNKAKEAGKNNKILIGQNIWHYGSMTSHSISNDFIHKETKHWKKYYSTPWYKRICSVSITSRHYSCYILGIHFGIRRKYK